MTDSSIATSPRPRRPNGPPAGGLAVVTLTLTIAGVVCLAALSGGDALGSPLDSPATVIARFVANTEAVRAGAVLQFGAGVPLGIYAATVYARRLRLGVRVPGPGIGFFGGVTAAIMLMISALIQWVLSRPEALTDTALVPALALLSFALGGIGYAVGIGLLVAGIAVPALLLGLLPRWLAALGLAIGVVAEVSFLSLVIEPLQFLLPVARFGGGLWLIAAGFLLPATRPRRAAGNTEEQA